MLAPGPIRLAAPANGDCDSRIVRILGCRASPRFDDYYVRPESFILYPLLLLLCIYSNGGYSAVVMVTPTGTSDLGGEVAYSRLMRFTAYGRFWISVYRSNAFAHYAHENKLE